jgi:hypothetical protein
MKSILIEMFLFGKDVIFTYLYEKKQRHFIVLWTRRARRRIDSLLLYHSNWVMLVFVSLHKLTFRSVVLLLACLSLRCRTKQCNYMLSLSCYGYHHYRWGVCIYSFSQEWHTLFSFSFDVYFVSSSHVRLSIDCSIKEEEEMWDKINTQI